MTEYHPIIAEALWNSGRFPEYANLYEFFKGGFFLTEDDRWQKFELEFSPWYEILCEWFDDPTVDWIYLIQASQTSKTTFMMGVLIFISKYVRGAVPVLWVQSTEDEAKLFVTERLKNVIENSSKEELSKWKQKYFKIGNSSVKIGYGTAVQSLRTRPARFVLGDECGIWRIPISYVKKRTRLFEGQRKGIFGTTPPFMGEHFSWKDATTANFYQWWVPCPKCGEYQALKFSNLVFNKGKIDGEWDYDLIKKIVRYKCEYCGDEWDNSQKLWLINNGKAVCVDPEDYKPVKAKKCDSKTLQITGLYSVATHWGQLVCDFLSAKAGGIESLKIFFTDELAEVPKEFGETVSNSNLSNLIDKKRLPGFQPGYALYTAGIDVQRLGDLYVVIMGWKPGLTPSGHVLDYFKCTWHGLHGQPKWDEFIDEMEDYRSHLYATAIDATDGVVSQQLHDFCSSQGRPYIALIDSTTTLKKVEYKQIKSQENMRRRASVAGKYMVINSDMVKDEIAVALDIPPTDDSAWSFHSETEDRFFKHLMNEHRITEISKRSRRQRNTWKPRYEGAPQHYFSALVYAVACMDDLRIRLQRSGRSGQARKEEIKRRPHSAIGNIYSNNHQEINPYSGGGGGTW